ncbi:MAG: 2-hydroxyacid dehydrogenase [Chloroflexi bacterium]|nr:2-hydroxyacid dehydrogenase [Chloroflexota bacterium]MDA1270902.1 2-hydroxyacid dehydrogenase [Chloroflexota bacterium]
MAAAKVVCFTDLDAELRQVVAGQQLPGMEVISQPLGTSEGEQMELVSDADYLIIWPAVLSDDVLRAAKKCKLVQLLSAGYDKMNLALAAELGIPVANNGGANSVAVAEHTMMLILATLKKLVTNANNVKAGGWRASQERRPDVFEFEGKTLGLIGIGNIAKKVAKRSRAFDAEVQYYDRFAQLSASEEQELGVKSVGFEELLKTSDVLSIHVPLTGETRGMISKEQLGMMKPSAVIINTSRGGIIDEADLAEALTSGVIAAAGLDVLEKEPPPAGHPLLALDNVIITPHTAGPTLESIPKRAANAFANIQRVIDGGEPSWTAQFSG